MRRSRSCRLAALVAVLDAALAPVAAAQSPAPLPLPGEYRRPDVIYIPTPPSVVTAMLELAAVGPNDVVYDLGSGDGRIPIAAVRDFGAARAVGIDIDSQRIREAVKNLEAAGLGDRVEFLNDDLFQTDISDATVVTLYLLPELNVKLRPRLWAELKPGTRIVSHQFDMGDWKADKRLESSGRTVYFWTIPDPKKRR
jgi:ribosomal protein L11 methylase PrmA